MPLWPKIATALLYFAVAAGVLRLAHRKVRRLSAIAALGLILLPLAFTGRALLSGRVYAPFDLAYGALPLTASRSEYSIGDARGIFLDVHCAIIPWHKAVRWAIAHREWPLMNPFLLCGDPLAGSAQPAPYDPVNLLALLVPLPWALTFDASLRMLLAALAAFLYLRELGSREEAALLGAAGWTLSSFIAFWIEWPLGAALSLAPLLLLAVRRLARQPSAGAAAILGAALLLATLAGHPESLVHLVALGAVAGVAEVVTATARNPERGAHRLLPVLRTAGWAIVAGAVTLGVAALFLLPIFDVLPQTLQWTLRLGSAHVMHAGKAPLAALAHLGHSLLPPQDASPHEFFLPPLASAYVGSVLWAPALFGLWRGRSRARFLLAAVGLLGLLAGARTPGLHELLGKIPLLGVSINERLIFVGALALVLLAALGVDAWMAGGGGRSLGLLAAAVAAAVGIGAWLLLPGARAAGMGDADFLTWTLWWSLPALAAAAALLLASRRPRAGAIALLLLLVAQRTGEAGSLYPTLPAAAFYPRVPPLDSLPKTEEPYRVVGHQFGMIPNDATLWEIEDPRGYQALHHRRFAETIPLWSIQIPVWFNRVEDLTKPFLSFLNVRYALTSRHYRPEGWNLVRRVPNAWLWENPHVLGRAFVPKRVRMGVPPEQTLREMAAETDFSRRAWIEPPGEVSRGAIDERQNTRGWAVAVRRGSGFHLTAKLKAAGWVVLSETAWKGWHAVETATGRELPLGVANHAFLALELPAGLHELDLYYRPRAFVVGRLVSGVTLGLLLLAAVGTRLRRKRSAGNGDDLSSNAADGINRRTGDRIAIAGGYQHRALHQGPAPQRFWHRAKLEEALALLRLTPGDRLLDAGCGSGLMSDMAAAAGARVTGVDANPEAIAFARQTFERPGLDFRLGLLDELDLPPASFERVVFLEVIEHLARRQGEEILARFRELLTPGGRLVLSTPNRKSLWPLLEWLLDRLHLVPQLGGEQHELLYTLDELRAMGEAAGLHLAEWRMINTWAPWAAWVSPRLAAAVHRWELAYVRRHGSVMVLAFEKPAS